MNKKRGALSIEKTIGLIILAALFVGMFFFISSYGMNIITGFRNLPNWKDPTKLSILPQQFRYDLTTGNVEWYAGEDWIKLPDTEKGTGKKFLTLRDKKVYEEDLKNSLSTFWGEGKIRGASLSGDYEFFDFNNDYLLFKLKEVSTFNNFWYVNNLGQVYKGTPTKIGEFSVKRDSSFECKGDSNKDQPFKLKKEILEEYKSKEPKFLSSISEESFVYLGSDRSDLIVGDKTNAPLPKLNNMKEFNKLEEKKTSLGWVIISLCWVSSREGYVTTFAPKEDSVKNFVFLNVVSSRRIGIERIDIYAIIPNTKNMNIVKNPDFIKIDDILKSPINLKFRNLDGTEGNGYYCAEKWEGKYLVVDLSSSKVVDKDAECAGGIYG